MGWKDTIKDDGPEATASAGGWRSTIQEEKKAPYANSLEGWKEGSRQIYNRLKTGANDVLQNYLPNVVGAVKTGSVSSSDYIKERDLSRQSLDAIPEGDKAVGHIGGGLLQAAVLPAVGAETALGRIGIGAGAGAATGLIQNPGEKEGEFSGPQLPERLSQAKTGGLIGAAGPAAIETGILGANAASKLSDSLKGFANKKAVKQAGAMLKNLKALDQKPGTSIQDTGEALLKNKVVTPLSNLENIADRSSKLLEEHGAKTGAVAKAIDSKFNELTQSPMVQHFPTGSKIADRMESEIISKVKDSPVLGHLAQPLQERANAFRDLGDAPIPFQKAEQWKREFDKLLNWDKEGKLGTQLLKQLRGTVNGVIEDGVEGIGAATQSPVFSQWKESKKLYGIMKDVNEIAEDRIFRNSANRTWSPSDYMATIGGLLAGSGHDTGTAAIYGAGAGAANHIARTYGNSLLATGAKKASDAVKISPDVLRGLRNKGLLQMGLLGGKLGAGN